jgi:hypothetical protein
MLSSVSYHIPLFNIHPLLICQWENEMYKEVSIISRTGAAIYAAVIVWCNDKWAVWTWWFLHPLFEVMYLAQLIQQRSGIRFCANLEKVRLWPCQWLIIQVIGEERMGCTWKAQSLRLKKAIQVKSKVKSILIIFFYIKGIVHKEFVLAGQTVNSAYYCDI